MSSPTLLKAYFDKFYYNKAEELISKLFAEQYLCKRDK